MVNKKRWAGNNSGEAFMWAVIFIIAFSVCSAIIFEVGNLYVKQEKVKGALNQAVKAAALAIHSGDYMADGIFLIEPNRAKYNFYQVLGDNLGIDHTVSEPTDQGEPIEDASVGAYPLNILDLGAAGVSTSLRDKTLLMEPPVIRELKILNVHPRILESDIPDVQETPHVYLMENTGEQQIVEYPTVVAVVEFEIKGIFIGRKIVVGKLSGAQLKSSFD